MVLLLRISSPSSLLHASLAHITPEVLAVDSIIECPGRCSRFPTELMLIVRNHLVHELAASLSTQSGDALASHAQSLVSLLCPDCASYNAEIYGTRVFDWPWDQFSGPCLCRGDIDDCLARTQPFTDNLAKLQCDPDERSALYRFKSISSSRPKSGQGISKGELLQFSQQLLDPKFFLELFLSRQTRRFARLAFKEELKEARCGRGQGTERVLGLLKVRIIWDVVGLVLGEQYQSEVIPRQTAACIPTHTATSPTPSTALGTKTPPKKTKIDPKSQPEDRGCAEIVDRDANDLEALRTCPSTLPSVTSSFPSSLMSPTYRRQQDPIYISLFQNRSTSVELQGDLWVNRALLLHAKASLGLSDPPSPSTPSCNSTSESPSHISTHDTNERRSCNNGGRSPSRPDTGSDNDNDVADFASQSPIHCLSVPSGSPATKPLPVLVAPTTGITATTGITEALDVAEVVASPSPPQNDVETDTTGVTVGNPDAKPGHIGRAVVVGAPGAEAKLAEPERQINHGTRTRDAGGYTVTTSSASSLSQGVGVVGVSFLPNWVRVPGVRLTACPETGGKRRSRVLRSALAPVPALIAACLYAPSAILGLVVTVLCFYTRPRSFRVL